MATMRNSKDDKGLTIPASSKDPHPLELKEPEMAKTADEAQPISSPPTPGLSDPDMTLPPALTLPGTTEVGPFPTLNGRWRSRLRERLARVVTARGIDAGLVPYLDRSEERADAAIGEILQTAGACGPIAETQAVLGARFAELAHYFIDHADPSTKLGRSEILLARACADTSRLNLEGALKTAVAIARAQPPSKGDPLAAYLDKPDPALASPTLEPQDSETE